MQVEYKPIAAGKGWLWLVPGLALSINRNFKYTGTVPQPRCYHSSFTNYIKYHVSKSVVRLALVVIWLSLFATNRKPRTHAPPEAVLCMWPVSLVYLCPRPRFGL